MRVWITKTILRQAEEEADVILWDGGNNDTSFYKPDLSITVLDPHRAGHELGYYPGEVNFRSADVLIINKVDTADPDGIKTVRQNIALHNPKAKVIETACRVTVDDPEAIAGKTVLVVEDGPTLTHGEMAYGAGVVAANRYHATDAGRSPTVCRRLDPEDLREVSAFMAGASGDGLQRPAAA